MARNRPITLLNESGTVMRYVSLQECKELMDSRKVTVVEAHIDPIDNFYYPHEVIAIQFKRPFATPQNSPSGITARESQIACGLHKWDVSAARENIVREKIAAWKQTEPLPIVTVSLKSLTCCDS